MNKFFKSALSLCVCFAMIVPAFAAPEEEYSFGDIAIYDWAAPDIEDMYRRGYISGYDDGTFKPENDVTRLECISLFARAMGESDAVNEPIVNMADQIYGDQLSSYDLGWGRSSVAYMLYKGALDWDDINTYLGGNAKNEPMKRYEAAIIITKAMNGEADALSDLGAMLDYTDSTEIPADAFQYVAYVGSKGIMRGMDDGSFSPQTAVKRSQIAIMLKNTVDLTDYTFARAKINGIDTTRMMMSTVNDDGITNVYAYDAAIARTGGQKIQVNLLPSGSDAVFTLSNGNLISVDVLSSVSSSVMIIGVYQGVLPNEERTFVQIIPDGATEVNTYPCSNAAAAVASGIALGETVTLEMTDEGEVSKISLGRYTSNAQTLSVKNATITSFNGASMTIAHSNPSYNGQTFTVRADAAVTKNSVISTLNDISAGDIVSLEISDGIVVSIDAISTSSPLENGSGIIKQIIISRFSSITINMAGQDRTFGFVSNPTFIRNSQTAALYDFRLGETVNITFNEQSISSMELAAAAAPQPTPTTYPEVEPTQPPAETVNPVQPSETTQPDDESENISYVEGTVTGVSPSGLIVLSSADGRQIQVWCRNESTEFESADGATKALSDIQVGQVLTVTGEQTGTDVYSAAFVLIN